MTFTAAAGDGTIALEGGGPANFFTSRRWLFEQGAGVKINGAWWAESRRRLPASRRWGHPARRRMPGHAAAEPVRRRRQLCARNYDRTSIQTEAPRDRTRCRW